MGMGMDMDTTGDLDCTRHGQGTWTWSSGMGMGLLTSAINKAEDKHRMGHRWARRAGKDPPKDPYNTTCLPSPGQVATRMRVTGGRELRYRAVAQTPATSKLDPSDAMRCDAPLASCCVAALLHCCTLHSALVVRCLGLPLAAFGLNHPGWAHPPCVALPCIRPALRCAALAGEKGEKAQDKIRGNQTSRALAGLVVAWSGLIISVGPTVGRRADTQSREGEAAVIRGGNSMAA